MPACGEESQGCDLRAQKVFDGGGGGGIRGGNGHLELQVVARVDLDAHQHWNLRHNGKPHRILDHGLVSRAACKVRKMTCPDLRICQTHMCARAQQGLGFRFAKWGMSFSRG